MAGMLLRGGSVLVGPPIDGRVEVADVFVEDGRIVEVGPDLSVGDVEFIDAEGRFVLPGFVDTHHHLWQTTMRGLTADWTLADYFWCIRRNHAVVHGPDDIYVGTYAGALASLEAGTTTTIDFSHCLSTPEHADEAVRGITDAGIRAVWCYGLYDPPVEQPAFAGPEERWEDLRRVAERYFAAPDGLVRMGLALNEIGLVPFEVTEGEVALARELELLLTAHTNVIWRPGERVEEVELLNDAGLLEAGQVHSHCNTCSDHELELLAVHGAKVSSTPETEHQMCMGDPILGRAREHGLTPSLGCDIQSNNRSDPFERMRLALQAERRRALQPTLEAEGMQAVERLPISTSEILHYATQGGADALGLGDVCGSIEPGKAADLLLLRADGLQMRPVVDPVASIVLHGSAGDVETVLVDGVVVKRDGRIAHRDPAEAVRSIDAAYERVAAAVDARGGWKPPMPEGFFDQVLMLMDANLSSNPTKVEV